MSDNTTIDRSTVPGSAIPWLAVILGAIVVAIIAFAVVFYIRFSSFVAQPMPKADPVAAVQAGTGQVSAQPGSPSALPQPPKP